MLTSWIDAFSPVHVSLYALAGDLTAEQADALTEPALSLVRRVQREYPTPDRPRTVPCGIVAFPRFPQTPHHWLLYALTATLNAEQARAARRPFFELVERVQAGEDVNKPAKNAAVRVLKGGRR